MISVGSMGFEIMTAKDLHSKIKRRTFGYRMLTG